MPWFNKVASRLGLRYLRSLCCSGWVTESKWARRGHQRCSTAQRGQCLKTLHAEVKERKMNTYQWQLETQKRCKDREKQMKPSGKRREKSKKTEQQKRDPKKSEKKRRKIEKKEKNVQKKTQLQRIMCGTRIMFRKQNWQTQMKTNKKKQVVLQDAKTFCEQLSSCFSKWKFHNLSNFGWEIGRPNICLHCEFGCWLMRCLHKPFPHGQNKRKYQLTSFTRNTVARRWSVVGP